MIWGPEAENFTGLAQRKFFQAGFQIHDLISVLGKGSPPPPFAFVSRLSDSR